MCVCVCVCIIGYGGQNDKVLLKIFKLFRIIQKKKKNSLIFFKNLGRPRLPSVLVMVRHCLQKEER